MSANAVFSENIRNLEIVSGQEKSLAKWGLRPGVNFLNAESQHLKCQMMVFNVVYNTFFSRFQPFWEIAKKGLKCSKKENPLAVKLLAVKLLDNRPDILLKMAFKILNAKIGN